MNLTGGLLGQPARSFTAALGDIVFETVLMGGVDINVGLKGLLGSISMDKLGQITLTAGGGLATMTLGLTGIEISYMGLSTLTLGPAGAELSGLTAKMAGTTTCDVEGLTTTVKGSVAANLEGALCEVKGTATAKVSAALANLEASGIMTAKGSVSMIG